MTRNKDSFGAYRDPRTPKMPPNQAARRASRREIWTRDRDFHDRPQGRRFLNEPPGRVIIEIANPQFARRDREIHDLLRLLK